MVKKVDIENLLKEMLEIDIVGDQSSLLELGCNSIKAIELEWEFSRRYSVEINIENNFTKLTPEQLFEKLNEKILTNDSDQNNIICSQEKSFYKATSEQERMFTLNRLNDSGVNYNVPSMKVLKGPLDKSQMERIVDTIVQRHEILRTIYGIESGEIVQYVQPQSITLEYFESDDCDAIINDFIRPFNLEKELPIRVGLIKLSAEKHVIMLDVHHIAIDGMSMDLLWKEFKELYLGGSLEPLRLQYRDYSEWKNSDKRQSVIQTQEEYWSRVFEGEIPLLDMPTDYVRPTVQSFEGSSCRFSLDKTITSQLKDLSKRCGATLYMTLLSVWNIQLSRYSGQEDILVGSPIAGRTHSDLSGMIGMFVNTLVMRNKPVRDKKYIDFLLEVKEHALMSYTNQDYPFGDLLELLEVPRILGRNPLFDVMFVLQERPTKNSGEWLELSRYGIEHSVSKFDLTMTAVDCGDTIDLHMEYSTKLYKKESIERMLSQFEVLVKGIVEDPNVKLGSINMLPEEEERKVLDIFNDTKTDYDRDKTIVELFEAQVSKTPNKVAVVYGDEALNYEKLNKRANQLARLLQEKGCCKNKRVAIIGKKCIDSIVGIFATLKVGAAYVPINGDVPRERLDYLLKDSNPQLILSTESRLISNISNVVHTEIIDLENVNNYKGESSNLNQNFSSSETAYVIHTSGSTGNPKGVMISHQSLNNYVQSITMRFDCSFKSDDVWLSNMNISFDASILEIFASLLNGVQLNLYTESSVTAEGLVQHFKSEQITISMIAPTLLRDVIELIEKDNKNILLNKIVVGVESIEKELLSRLVKVLSPVRILNGYGPTETTICATIYSFTEMSRNTISKAYVPIGKPLNNTQVYILDDNQGLQPIGVVGELCIAGEGVGQGYLNKPETTAEKYVDNPFGTGKMYKTGDYARWLSTGDIEFLGRRDHQIKLRGYRIELGEVENKLRLIPKIHEAVVLLDKSNIDSSLRGYVVSDSQLTMSELRIALAEKLPDYMIPDSFVQVPEIPRTTNGKTDMKKLSLYDMEMESGTNFVEATTDLECQLVEIYRSVLGREKISITDDFFMIGGHSLKAMILIGKIRQEFKLDVALDEFFGAPTIAALSKVLESKDKNEESCIALTEEKPFYKATSEQERMFTLNRLNDSGVNYNVPSMKVLKGPLDKSQMERIVDTIVQRHEILRTIYGIESGEIVQYVQPQSITLEYFESDDCDAIINDFIRPFNLEKELPIRVGLIKLSAEKHVIMLDVHHIAIDGMSMDLLWKEFKELYLGGSLEPLRLQYKDYSEWKNSDERQSVIQTQEEYWSRVFEGEIPLLDMPTDYVRPTVQSFEGSSCRFSLDKTITSQLKDLSKRCGATLYMTLLSVWNIQLSRYSGQEDILVGSPIVGRTHSDLSGMIGMFVNTLVMRNKPVRDKKYIDFLLEVKEHALMSYTNQDYPFGDLLELLEVPRILGRNPLFDVMFVLQERPTKNSGEGLELFRYGIEHSVSKFDLTMTAVDCGDTIDLHMEYSTKLYKKESIERMLSQFEVLVKGIVEDPNVKLGSINMLPEEEERKVLDIFNDTKTDYDRDKTIVELFEAQVLKTPNKVAVVYGDETLSYDELDKESNVVARRLRELGVDRNDSVVVVAEKGLEMIIGICGILKAGGAYVPVDSSYPSERIEFIIDDCSPKAILTYNYSLNSNLAVMELDRVYERVENNEKLERINSADDLAYLIYTSGTTGKPKGTMVEHRSVNRLVKNTNYFDFNENEILLQTGSVSFDAFTFELWGMLLNGGTVVLADREMILDPGALKQYSNQKNITTMWLTSTLFNHLVTQDVTLFDGLSNLLIGGEKLSESHVRMFKAHNKRTCLVNGYGPTENTTFTSTYIIPDDFEFIPIGKPISNTQIYIMNDENLCGINMKGELCIGGDGVARGYLNRHELTSKRFVKNPFGEGMLYRSGDYARWLSTGDIDFIGRDDNQVKVRGYRIELDEVEKTLHSLETVDEAIVKVKEFDNGEKALWAYIAGAKVDVNELYLELSNVIPQYMIPDSFVQVPEIPRTTNGKTDMKKLSLYDMEMESGTNFVEATTDLECQLVEIYRSVLGREKISITDDFFMIGGHSLKAMILIGKIRQEFKLDVALDEFFGAPTIAALSKVLESKDKNEESCIALTEEKPFYKATSEQERMFTLNRLNDSGVNYNVPSMKVLKGPLDKSQMERIVDTIVQRHEILRTIYGIESGEIVQYVQPQSITLEYFESDDCDAIINDFIRPFNLEKELPIRVGLIKLSAEKHVIMLDVHHIAIDGMSMDLLWKEFKELYLGGSLEPLRLQYKDYSEWKNSDERQSVIQTQEEYWSRVFEGEIPLLDMPTDYVRPTVQSFEGSSCRFSLDKTITSQLKDLSKRCGATLYMTLLSVWNIQLSRYSGQEDILVGSPIVGRTHSDLSGMIGMFVNTLVMRNKPVRDKKYIDFLLEVKEHALMSYTNQDYPFGDLLELLEVPRILGRNPLFDVMFVLQERPTKNSGEGLELSRYGIEHSVSKFDLTMTAVDCGDTIDLHMEYSTKLYKKESIERMLSQFEVLVKGIVEDPNVKLGSINMLPEEEERKVLDIFNDTKTDYDRDKTIVELFEAQVLKTPNKVAVVYGDETLSYDELDKESNVVARRLRELGVDRNDSVVVVAEKGLEMIIGICGILKAGGAYVPVDSSYPSERIEFIIDDCSPKAILTYNYSLNSNLAVMELDRVYERVENNEKLERINSADDLAYLIYTSGTTGKPKGTMVEHRSVNRLVKNTNYFDFNENEILLQTGSVSFDAFTFELWGMLLNGGTVVLADREMILDPGALKQYSNQKNITTMWLTSTLFNHLVTQDVTLFDGLSNLLIGGEKLSESHVRMFKAHNKRTCLVNGYGPTENTTFTSTYIIPDDFEFIPIGKPISNTQIYIMNDENLCGINMKGELCIGGDGVARGYLNRHELTSKRFVKNPFGEGMLYRSGDYARWLSTGDIDFIGRDDNQVKVRGYRIELDEVEKTLHSLETVDEAIVKVKEFDNGEKALWAYIAGAKVDVNELYLELSNVIPQYMIPDSFVQVPEIPRTTNGKTDMKKLSLYDMEMESGTNFVEATTDLECQLVEIYRSVLGREKISITDDFFMIGGHSLKAMILIGKIRQEFKLDVALDEFFGAPTIAALSKVLESKDKNEESCIALTEEKPFYKATSEQERMFTLNRLNDSGVNYNVPSMKVLKGPLDKSQMERIVDTIVQRHEILRTIYGIESGEIVQYVQPQSITLEYFESDDCDAIINDFIRPFNLEKELPIRVGLIKLSAEKHVIMLDVHHIAIDGMSMDLLWKEFKELYLGGSLEPLRLQYKDYSEWKNSDERQSVIQTQEEYWSRVFEGEIPLLDMPTDYVRPTVQSFEGSSCRFSLDKTITSQLKDLSKRCGATLYMTLLSVWNIQLSRYSGQEDILVGSPIVGRTHSDLSGMIGMFVNTLVMRNKPVRDKKYIDFLLEVKEHALMSYTNQDYPFGDLLELLEVPRILGRNPLFDVMFVLQERPTKNSGEGLELSRYGIEHSVSKFDLTMTAVDCGDTIDLHMEYSTKLYKKESIERMLSQFEVLVKGIVEDPNVKLGSINMLPEEEERKVLDIFNDTKTDYDRDKTIVELFEAQVSKTPNKVAVVYGDETLSYDELDKKSNVVARRLRELGVDRNDSVVVVAEKGLEMIIGICGILKAGGAYVPVDSSYPSERIEFIIDDCSPKAILTYNYSLNSNLAVMELDRVYERVENNEKLERINSADDLAYLIYTSGTTGKPKGTMVEHRSVNRLVKNTNYFDFNENEILLQTGSLSFDLSTFEIWGMLLNGGTVVLADREMILDPGALKQYSNQKNITTMWLTSTLFNHLVTQDVTLFDGLSNLLIGGEKLSESHVRMFKAHNKRTCLINGYGPTENTTFTSTYIIPDDFEFIPIGKPISNTQIYIMNDENLCGINMKGELCIGGDGVARGYLNRHELTSKRFVKNPFGEGMLYRSGDYARWLSTGDIDFIGRDDNQVKVRGYRIELDEVEKTLHSLETVDEAVVKVKEFDNGEKALWAYIAGAKVDVNELYLELSNVIPQYMIPDSFVQVPEIPRTTNGKTDMKKLSLYDMEMESGTNFVEATTDLECQLVEIYRSVLGREKISITDDFFMIGGHSLKAMILIGKIRREFKLDVALDEFFGAPTIAALSKVLDSKDKNEESCIALTEEKPFYKATSEQERMFTLNRLNDSGVNYNVPSMKVLKGPLDKSQMERIVDTIVQRHEILRTIYGIESGEIVQYVQPQSITLEYFESDDCDAIINDFIRPFNLEKELPIRVGLIKLSAEKHVIMLDVHHIAIDGMSMDLLWKEFKELYLGGSLEPLRLQYKDYSEWKNSDERQSVIQTQEEYWSRVFEGEIPLLDMPTDYVRPTVQSFEGSSCRFSLDKTITSQLKDLSKRCGATLYMTLLSVWNIQLSRYSGQEDILVGSPIAGRTHSDLSGMIGMFVNTLVMRNKPVRDKKYIDFLLEVKEHALMSYTNQDYPFGDLLELLEVPRILGRNPLFDVMFVLQERPTKNSGEWLELSRYGIEHSVSKFDLTMTAVDCGDTIDLHMEYSTKLYKKESIERMLSQFEVLVKGIVEDPNVKLGSINMLPEEEERKVLDIFNDTKTDYDRDKTIVELFEAQVSKTPNKVAVVYGDEALNYEKLNKRANQLARLLQEKGCCKNKRVAIIGKKCIDSIVGIFATLKVGAAYVPINGDVPRERLDYLLKDSNPQLILSTESRLISNISNVVHTEIIDLENVNNYKGESSNLNHNFSSSETAYVIYTSGSTGNPKGVMISHQSLNNFIKSLTSAFDKTYAFNDVWSSNMNISFDASVIEIFTSLVNGVQLNLYTESSVTAEGLVQHFKSEQITISMIAPTLLRDVIEHIEKDGQHIKLEKLLVGIESIEKELLSRLIKRMPNIQILNCYGPTETTICATIYSFTEMSRNTISKAYVPIGKPLNNTQVYILDDNQGLQPIGVVGELCVAGEGVGQGYLNKPETTAEKYVDNPFGTGKMYKTGDYARWLSTGDIEFLGRRDHQIKLRGYRIELGEVENKLRLIPKIHEAVVLLDKSNIDSSLRGYVVSDSQLTMSELRIALAEKLPDYMIPDSFVQVPEIPRTTNGKTDMKKLSLYDMEMESGTNFVEATTDLECQLVEIYRSVLGREKISITDDFFMIGGHSLKAMVLIGKIKNELNVEIELHELIRAVSIYKMSKLIIEKQVSLSSNIIMSTDTFIVKNYQNHIDNKIAVIIMHDLRGDSIGYANVINRMPKKLDVLAIERMAVGRPEKFSMKEIAKDYSRIKKVTYFDKYDKIIVLGWSYGGLLAYEFVEECNKERIFINSLVMIDSRYDLNGPRNTGGDDKEFWVNLLYERKEEMNNISRGSDCFEVFWTKFLESIRFNEDRLMISKMHAKLLGFSDSIDVMIDRDLLKRMCVIKSLEYSYLSYQPTNYDSIGCSMYYILPEEESHLHYLDFGIHEDLILTTPGNHFSIMNEEKSEMLVKMFVDVINKEVDPRFKGGKYAYKEDF